MNLSFRADCRPRVAALLLAAVIAIGVAGCNKKGGGPSNQKPNGTAQQDGEANAKSLADINEALAATENLETEKATELWADLRTRFSDDPSVALNLALSEVLRVDELTSTATDSVKTAEEKKAARSKLPTAIANARAAVNDYRENSGDKTTPLWLDSRVDANEATLLPGSFTKSLRKELFTKLTSAISKGEGDSQSLILGGPLAELLEQLADPIDGVPDDILKPAAAAMRTLSDEHPDNLFLALQALRLSVDEQSTDATQYADRTWQLVRAVEPTLAAYTKPIGLTPEDLKQQINDAVGAGDWAKADQSLVLWSNVLGPLEILRTDRRRASPHPLDRLDFNTVRLLSAKLAAANPLEASTSDLTFETAQLGDDIRAILAVDADLDLDLDLVTTNQANELQLWTNQDGSWENTGTLKLDVQPAGMLAADLFMVDSSDSDRIKQTTRTAADDVASRDYSTKNRHDTLPGLVLYGEFGARLVQIDTRPVTDAANRLVLIDEATGLEDLPPVQSVITGDLEGDGDLDLIVAPKSGLLRTFINRGNRTFFEVEVGANVLDGDDPVTAMAIADLDRDLDLDVITTHAKSGRVGILENLLHLQFRMRYLDGVPATESPNFVAVEDVDGNVGWDVIVASPSQTMVAFANSAGIGVWSVDRVETGKGFAAAPALADLDNDSFLELFTAEKQYRLGPWGVGDLKAAVPGGESVLAADFDSDGRIDLAAVDQAKAAISLNRTESTAHHLAVRFRGIADNAASSGRVNHFAIGSVLELRFGPHYRSRIVTSPSTHFGMDGIGEADSIRVIMPNGLTQTIRQPEPNAIVEEAQTLKGSCPYLYGWDGEKFAFVTDCLWAAPLGLQVASGVIQQGRPWEYLKLDGDLLQPTDDGSYELRLTEELWEVAYVDHVSLMAVDHPSDIDIFTNEKVGPPSVATPTVYAFDAGIAESLVAAVDTNGTDVTALLTENDGRYVQGFDRRIRQGLCPPHWIDLEFNATSAALLENDPAATAYLVLRGWILPTDTSLNIQIDQNPELPAIEFPSVWVPDSESESGWRKAIEYMGFPGGKPKTIVVDVTEHLQADDPRLRIRTSAQIYWDSAALAVSTKPGEYRSQEMPLADAEVTFHGFSKRIKAGPMQPEWYDYGQPESQPKWPPLRGQVSRFGPCVEQLRQWDDAMVVISGGDEIRMRFDAPSVPLPNGWKRDFVLHCVGWDKDADLNTLTGQSIGPLPIRDMSSYPPTLESREPFDAVRRKNASSLRRQQSFRAFWYRNRPTGKAFLTAGDDG